MIAGVECVLDCFKKGSMPGLLRKYPIFNFALEGEMIATTGYNDENVRKEIARKVRTLGGWFTDDLRKQVTILIAHPDALSSPKCVAARRIRGIAIVSLEWLSKTDASGEKQPLENYELFPPIFKDCVITVSGFNFEARSREMIVGLTEKHGGTYQSVLPKIGR
jgi:hypothetical protein